MENHDMRKVINKETGNTEIGEPPIKSITEEVTPNEYKVEIHPEDWVPNCTIVECEITVPGMHESCICKAYPNDDMISNKASDREYAQRLIKDIYNGVLIINTDTYKIKCKWIGDRPKETIYLDLEELPFFDVPGSKFGL